MAKFVNKATLAELKQRNGNANITMHPTGKPGIFMWCCGTEGASSGDNAFFSANAAAKFNDKTVPDSAFQYGEITGDDGTLYKMITLAGAQLQAAVATR